MTVLKCLYKGNLSTVKAEKTKTKTKTSRNKTNGKKEKRKEIRKPLEMKQCYKLLM